MAATFYSTGPVENALGNASAVLALDFLNNNDTQVKTRARVYNLTSGTKTLIYDTEQITLGANSGTARIVTLLDFLPTLPLRFEVVYSATAEGVFYSMWGEINGLINAHHRFAHAELTQKSYDQV